MPIKCMISDPSHPTELLNTHLLEVGAGSENLVYEILNGEDVVLAEGLLNDGVVGEGDALLVDLAVAALVDKLTDRLQVGLAEMER